MFLINIYIYIYISLSLNCHYVLLPHTAERFSFDISFIFRGQFYLQSRFVSPAAAGDCPLVAVSGGTLSSQMELNIINQPLQTELLYGVSPSVMHQVQVGCFVGLLSWKCVCD